MNDIEETNPDHICFRKKGVFHYCEEKLRDDVDHFEVLTVWGVGYVAHEEGRYRCYKCKRFISEELIMALRLANE